MITSINSHDDELQVNGAFANISLIASKVWAYDQEDTYRKLNQSLWLQNCKLSETYNGKNGKAPRVRDVIPTSRLANYGNYEYNVNREKMYNNDEITRETWTAELPNEKHFHEGGACRDEPWMLKQVEECFARLLSPPTTTFLSLSKIQQFYEEENGKYVVIPYAIDDNNELQLQARVSSKVVKDLWRPVGCSGGELTAFRGQRSSARILHDPRLFNDEAGCLQDEKNLKIRRHAGDKRSEIRKNSQQSSYALRNERNFNAKRPSALYPVPTSSSIHRPIVPVLSAEVAEFFPKGPTATISEENRQGSIQFFPSSAEPSYKNELFPYNPAHFSSSSTFPHNTAGLAIAVSHPTTVNTWIRAPHQWIHRIGPPIQLQVPGVGTVNHPPLYSTTLQPFCPTIVHRPINLHEKIFTPGGQTSTGQIPVYQRPPELYQETSQRRVKNHHQGVDFNNLILLTKNAMKARRNQSKNPRQASSFILESRQPNLKSESDVLQWLNKGYPKRAREFGTVNSLVSELSRFEVKCDCARTMEIASSTSIISNEFVEKEISDATDADALEEEGVIEDSNVPTIAKKRLYRDVLTNNTATSDYIVETLLDKRYDELEQQAMDQYRTSEECIALRYQELERQGLEQYKYGDSSSESIRAICSATLCSGRHCNDRTMTTESGERDEGSDSIGNNGIRCSGFEKRSCCDISPGKDIHSSDADKAGPAMERPITILRSDIKCAPVTSNVRLQGTIGQFDTCTRATTVLTKSLTALNQASFVIRTKNPIKGASGDKIEGQVQSSTNCRHPIVMSHPKRIVPSIRTDAINDRTITSGYCNEAKIVENGGGIPSGGGDEKVTILRSPGAQVWLSSFWR